MYIVLWKSVFEAPVNVYWQVPPKVLKGPLVTLDGEDNMQVSLANQTGFVAAYKHGVHVKDWFSASFDKLRSRAVTLAGEALSNWGHGNVGLVADRKLQDDASANSDHTDSNQFAGYSHGTLISRFKRWCTLVRRVTLGR